MTPDVPPPPPLLWGAWRASINERFYTGWCPSCGADVWLHRDGFDGWRASCENGCSREAMDEAAEILLDAQRRREAIRMNPDDPFATIDAARYIEALYPDIESKRNFYCCPFHGDGNERTPSLHATGLVWHCFGCGKGGTIYDLAALKWGIEPRRDGFKELQSRLALAMRRGVGV